MRKGVGGMILQTMKIGWLVAGLLICVVVAPGEADSSRSGLPRLEFETPPVAVAQPGPVLVPETLRGVMGYRLPLVSRQQVPGQVVSGVLIPAHTTYVILKPGHWELVGAVARRNRGPAGCCQ